MLQNSNKQASVDLGKGHADGRRDSGGLAKPITPASRRDSDELAKPVAPEGRKESVDGGAPPNNAQRKSSVTVHDPVFEKRRSSFSADALPAPAGRRGSVDIFEGLPMSRRGSISPLAPKLEAPTINQVESPAGDHIILQCRITSDTEPEITWAHLDDRIKNDSRHKMYTKKEDDVWVASLEIKDIIRKDAGKYSVRAKNAAGQNYATVFSYIE